MPLFGQSLQIGNLQAHAWPPMMIDLISVVAELAGNGRPPNIDELTIELDTEDGETRAAVLDLAERGLVESFVGDEGSIRWRSLLSVEWPPEVEFVGTFEDLALARQVMREIPV